MKNSEKSKKVREYFSRSLHSRTHQFSELSGYSSAHLSKAFKGDYLGTKRFWQHMQTTLRKFMKDEIDAWEETDSLLTQMIEEGIEE